MPEQTLLIALFRERLVIHCPWILAGALVCLLLTSHRYFLAKDSAFDATKMNSRCSNNSSKLSLTPWLWKHARVTFARRAWTICTRRSERRRRPGRWLRVQRPRFGHKLIGIRLVDSWCRRCTFWFCVFHIKTVLSSTNPVLVLIHPTAEELCRKKLRGGDRRRACLSVVGGSIQAAAATTRPGRRTYDIHQRTSC